MHVAPALGHARQPASPAGPVQRWKPAAQAQAPDGSRWEPRTHSQSEVTLLNASSTPQGTRRTARAAVTAPVGSSEDSRRKTRV